MRYSPKRKAINQAEIWRKSKPFGTMAEGGRAFRSGLSLSDNPYAEGTDHRAWAWGWEQTQEKADE